MAADRLVDHLAYADAQRLCSRDALWELFDGDRERLNIAHECLDRHPRDRVAIRIAHGDGRIESHSFGEVSDLASRTANWLAGRGIGAGERVAIMLDPSLAFYAALFGVMKAGAVAVPLFTAFGPDGLAARLSDCSASLLILAPGLGRLAGTCGVTTVLADDGFLAELSRQDAVFAPATAAGDMALFQYTSGTSRAMPEAVRHRHRAVVTVMIAALYATGVRPGDRFLCPSSPAWGHGLWHGTIAPLALGVEITGWAGKFDPDRLLDVIERLGITTLSAAATHYRMMRTRSRAADRSFAVRKLSFTGEPVDAATADWAGRTFGTDLCSIYGTTEVGVIIADYPGADDHEVRPGALGRPLPGCEVSIRDRDGAACPVGAVGEISVRRSGGWIGVKDLGRMDADGYFYHLGRADDVILSAGWTLSAIEIEDVLLHHPDIEEAAAIGVPDPERGQAVAVFIVTRRAGEDGLAGEVAGFVADRLGRHARPRRVDCVVDLPKTPAGKVNRRVLREREAAA